MIERERERETKEALIHLQTSVAWTCFKSCWSLGSVPINFDISSSLRMIRNLLGAWKQIQPTWTPDFNQIENSNSVPLFTVNVLLLLFYSRHFGVLFKSCRLLRWLKQNYKSKKPFNRMRSIKIAHILQKFTRTKLTKERETHTHIINFFLYNWWKKKWKNNIVFANFRWFFCCRNVLEWDDKQSKTH